LRAILDDPGDWGPCNDALLEGRGVRVTVDGGTEPLFFYYGNDPSDASILDVILPGTIATTLRVHEPGFHTFRVAGDGFEPASATVWMTVGEPVELSIPLRELP
jgi:hypothetical protein